MRHREYTRNGIDLSPRLKHTAADLARLKAESAILDGELVANTGGFWAISSAIAREQVTIAAFDLLHMDGTDLRGHSLMERKGALAALLLRAPACIVLVATFDDPGQLLRAAEAHGVEGIVSKRRDAPYRSGKRPEWVKVKTRTWVEDNRERGEVMARRGR